MAAAVTNVDSSLASQSTASAMAFGSAIPSGRNPVSMLDSWAFDCIVLPISSTIRPEPMSVATGPGCTLLTRIECLPSSAAKPLAIPVTACLLVV
jgi:hypothetical protein